MREHHSAEENIRIALSGLRGKVRIADHKITKLDELLPWRYAAKAA